MQYKPILNPKKFFLKKLVLQFASSKVFIPDDLDGDLWAALGGVPGSHHVAEHALARVPEHIVPVQQIHI